MSKDNKVLMASSVDFAKKLGVNACHVNQRIRERINGQIVRSRGFNSDWFRPIPRSIFFPHYWISQEGAAYYLKNISPVGNPDSFLTELFSDSGVYVNNETEKDLFDNETEKDLFDNKPEKELLDNKSCEKMISSILVAKALKRPTCSVYKVIRRWLDGTTKTPAHFRKEWFLPAENNYHYYVSKDGANFYVKRMKIRNPSERLSYFDIVNNLFDNENGDTNPAPIPSEPATEKPSAGTTCVDKPAPKKYGNDSPSALQIANELGDALGLTKDQKRDALVKMASKQAGIDFSEIFDL